MKRILDKVGKTIFQYLNIDQKSTINDPTWKYLKAVISRHLALLGSPLTQEKLKERKMEKYCPQCQVNFILQGWVGCCKKNPLQNRTYCYKP